MLGRCMAQCICCPGFRPAVPTMHLFSETPLALTFVCFAVIDFSRALTPLMFGGSWHWLRNGPVSLAFLSFL